MRSLLHRPRARAAVVALVAGVGALGATASAASANLPQWGPTPDAFSVKGGAAQIELAHNGPVVKCTGTYVVNWSGPNIEEFRGTVGFTGCTFTLTAFKKVYNCKSTGAAENEIVSPASIHFPLEYLSAEHHEVALVANYQESGEAKELLTFSCGFLGEIKARGAVVIKITPVNHKSFKFTLAMNSTSGVQELTKFENRKGAQVEAQPEFKYGGGEPAYKPGGIDIAGLEMTAETEAEIKG